MIKRVIFDIDDTLIPWEKEYDKEINKALDELKITYIDKEITQISKALSEYENVYYTFNKEKMAEYINEYTKKEYPKEFIYNIIKKWENCVQEEIDQEIIETLEYLKPKYEIVSLTDWYADSQKARLRKLGIDKYFETIYSAENTKRKPFREAFMQAIGTNKPEECIMVGDNLERDVKGALEAGLQAVYYTKNKIEEKEFYTISKIEELIRIL